MNPRLRNRGAAHTGPRGGVAELGARSAGRPRASTRRPGGDAQQWTDRQLDAHLEPGRELLPGRVVHADLAAATALAAAHAQRAAPLIEVGFAEREGSWMRRPARPKAR